MKKILLFLLIVASLSISAENSVPIRDGWMKLMPKKRSTELKLDDYKKAFNEYWKDYNVVGGYYINKDGRRVKASGWKQYKRWEYAAELTQERGRSFPKKTAVQAFESYNRTLSPAARAASFIKDEADWKPLGPYESAGGYAGIGRLNAVAFHPTKSEVIWVGAPAGGLWRSDDDGQSWECLTDQLGCIGVSDIFISKDYDQNGTIYIATGDKNVHYGELTYSIGLWKSTDYGKTWSPTSLQYNLGDAMHLFRILVDPANESIIYVATTKGVYKSSSAGADFDLVVPIGVCNDMEFAANDYTTIYAVGLNGIFKITNSGGVYNKSFSFYNVHDTDNEVHDYARAEIAVDQTSGSVYCVSTVSDGGLNGIFRLDSGSEEWKAVYTSPNILGYDITNIVGLGGQGNYDLTIQVDPINGDVYVGGINTWRSKDRGVTWSPITIWAELSPSENPDNVYVVHADKHFLAFRPTDNKLFECNDGGLYSFDGDYAWLDRTNGLQISQIYKIAVNPNNSNEVLCGLQDNGSKRLHNGSWSDIVGGDGMWCGINANTDNVQYATYVNGDLYKTEDYWNSNISITPSYYNDNGQLQQLSGAWVTPFLLNPLNPNIIYGGYIVLIRSNNQGDSWVSPGVRNWKIISKDEMLDQGSYRSLAIAESDTATLYAATDALGLWRTYNSGADWVDITAGLPNVNEGQPYNGNFITSIQVKQDDHNTLWIAYSGYDSEYRVVEGTNGGANWRDISQGLPPLPVYTIVRDKVTGYLYAGTELGVYIKKGDDNWTLFKKNLPNVKVFDLCIYYSENHSNSVLKAGTYGRGLWETKLVSITTAIKDVVKTVGDANYQLFLKNNTLTIANEEEKAIGKIELFTSTGTLISSQTSYKTVETMDITSSGVYVVRLTNNNKTATYKFVR